MINLSNYEEWFVLYMDNELTPSQIEMVETFVQQHPRLQEEMDLLLGTKLTDMTSGMSMRLAAISPSFACRIARSGDPGA